MPTRGGGPPSTAGFIPMPYNPGPKHPSSNQFLMPAPEIRPPPTAAQEQAVVGSNELSQLACMDHYHRSTTLDLIPSGRTEGYSVQWQCEMLFWNLKVCANFEFRRIKCSKSVEAPSQELWESIMCEHLLRLHRIGQLKKDWCKNNVDLTGGEDKMNESRDTKPQYMICAPKHVRRHPPFSKDLRVFLSSAACLFSVKW
ncbi:hypothetical protein B9Z19DRAFT_1111229 [Tuber borchii]|uniref:Uncharacterized protein n=1 Tax=Tuber borchii TaxID=42251 RepID=A0A2T6ZD33_TUBBO|nr:hypothetical protein B9Z19DRAFT_1111229 [Tuber borchii]